MTTDYITIKENLKKILKENNLDDESIINYDLNETLIENVIEDLNTYGFLVPRKVIVCTNPSFLMATKGRGSLDQNIDAFINYLTHPSEDNILVLIGDNFDERKSVVKALKDNSIIYDEEINIFKMIKKKLEDYVMEDTVINYFIDYCSNDNEKILNELEKLKSYKADDKKITYDDIDKVVIKSFSDNIFSLIEAIMARNKKKSLRLYNELINNGEDINKILSMLCDQFRMIYNGRILLKEHHNNYKEVAGILGIHPYRFQKAIESSAFFSVKDIINDLKRLDDIEIGLKTGKNTSAAFEIFIYNL